MNDVNDVCPVHKTERIMYTTMDRSFSQVFVVEDKKKSLLEIAASIPLPGECENHETARKDVVHRDETRHADDHREVHIRHPSK